MVYRIFVEKKPAYADEAQGLLKDLRSFLGITGLEQVRVLNRYDAEGLSAELFRRAVATVFSEPQVDTACEEPELDGATVFAVEYLPGQFDQRADSAAQCIQILSQGERPVVKSAKVYALYGALTEENLKAIKKYVINPVEAREATAEKPETLSETFPVPADVAVLDGFRAMDEAGLEQFRVEYGLAMDLADLLCCRDYFTQEQRDPSMTEIRVLDTYWSDHCRHTTFLTQLDEVTFEDEALQAEYENYLAVRRELGRTKPICLMDLGTLAAKYLRTKGMLDKLDESEEINACTVKITVQHDGREEPWLLLFKNETHNHPTEIEPFGGAATCIGGAIRDPLSGRSYVYAAMRVTGAADPTVPVEDTIPGKLPQRKLVTTAAAGYSSYGNQIGLATGMVDELYHPGYAAKRMEIGAVIAAAPEANVRRERPAPGDVVILLGGRTGRDGIGGATGSSKAHTVSSLEQCGAEVQKGNAPVERKLQRLFRKPEASRLIKRCNDFGAGGVSVAIGELADGLEINLDSVPKKYEGLDGTELAISESQERMAVVVAPEDAEAFLALSEEENLEATVAAVVTEEPRLRMNWRGSRIVDLSRAFLDTNGAEKHISVTVKQPGDIQKQVGNDFAEELRRTASDLNCCSKRGLSERFDSTIGAGTVLMPFGGKYQRTPIQAMVQKISTEHGDTDSCSFMSWGYNPYVSEKSPFHGAYLAVVESVCKLIATGAEDKDIYLTFQEYFEKPGTDSTRWGKPLAALLGAFKAQLALGYAAIGGKDSMSGSFEKLDVPPTLVSFAVTTGKIASVLTPECKRAGHQLWLLKPECDQLGLPTAESLRSSFRRLQELKKAGAVYACYTPGMGGVAEAVLKMCFGNGFGFEFTVDQTQDRLFGHAYGSLLVETDAPVPGAELVGTVTEEQLFRRGTESVAYTELSDLYDNRLSSVYPCKAAKAGNDTLPTVAAVSKMMPVSSFTTATQTEPTVLIPVFPGTNCEYDSAKAVAAAGMRPEIFVINNLSSDGIRRSVEEFAARVNQAQMIFVPGGFSGGDEPDGSGKFITAFFRNGAVKEAVTELLDLRGGLVCGICNGFQALIKLGLVPYGRILDTDETCPTLTFNTIGRHQSRIVRTRVVNNASPFLRRVQPGDIISVPISHGEGRFTASEEVLRRLVENGQIATQYVDLNGTPTEDIDYNPNGSLLAIEGITSPDGRVFGKMGHSERVGTGLYKNVPGDYNLHMFEAAADFLR